LPIEQSLKEIETFDCRKSLALSVYLDLRPRVGTTRALEEEVARALGPERDAQSRSKADAWQLERATHFVLSAIGSLDPIPRAVAAFACPDRSFVRVIPLPESVGTRARFTDQFDLVPLMSVLDEYEKTVVALVDREHARVFRVFMGQIEEVAHLEDGGRRHTAAGRAQQKAGTGHTGTGTGAAAIQMGYGERNIERRDDWHVRQHLERTLAAMRPDGDRVLLGGGMETVHELVRLLPRRVRHRTRLIAGLPVDAHTATVLERVLLTQHEAEREEEEELIDVITEGDRSVFGMAAVAEAVCDGRAHTLVYAADLDAQGSECPQCGWLSPGSTPEACGRCGGPTERCSAFIETLANRVHESGGRVEEVRGRAQKTLLRHEGVAALLRWVPKGVNPTPNTEPRKVTNGSEPRGGP
jgi:hypothetical protein